MDNRFWRYFSRFICIHEWKPSLYYIWKNFYITGDKRRLLVSKHNTIYRIWSTCDRGRDNSWISFIFFLFLRDLHAHVINVFFVLAVLGILYAWIKRNSGKSWKQKEIFLLGLFLGIFLFSNTWDFMIYYVVICGTLFLEIWRDILILQIWEPV